MRSLGVGVLVLTFNALVSPQVPSVTEHYFKMYDIVPKVVNTHPKQFAVVRFRDLKMQPGFEFTLSEVQFKPSVRWELDRGSPLHLLMLIDPDYNLPVIGTYEYSFLHWMVGNIPDHIVKDGHEVVQYKKPDFGHGIHRLVLLIFKQPDKIVYEENLFPERFIDTNVKRSKFNLRSFVRKYELKGPVAGSFCHVAFNKTKRSHFL